MTVPKEVTELIQNSGNSFHAKVAQWFMKNKWHVVVSPYYMDQTQGKAREIDLVAEKLWPVTDMHGHPSEHLAVRLFLECKYVASTSVFWFADKDRQAALERVCADGTFRRSNAYTEEHHYLSQSQRVAKVFSSSNAKAAENDPFYKALNQVLNAMASMSGYEVTIPSFKKKGQPPKALLEFPVVVCSSFDAMYSVDFLADPQPVPVKDNFQLEVRYAYMNKKGFQRDDYFLVDFVAFDKLAELERALDVDAKAAAALVGD